MKRPEGFDPSAPAAPEPTKRPGKKSAALTAPPREELSPAGVAAAERRRIRKGARARRRFERGEVRRFTRRSRRRRATWVTVAAVVGILGAVLAVAIFSPILALREITVDGTAQVDESEVRAAVDGQLGVPLALLDFGRIEDELTEFSLIRSYVTETVPPNTLRIHVVERQAIATIQNDGGFDQIDAAGVVMSSSPERPALPLVDVGGDGVESAGFRSAAAVLLAMPEGVRSRVDIVTARTADDVGLKLVGTAQEVVWGSADDSELKATVLDIMLTKRPECLALPVIDVSAPRTPICGPK